MQYDRQWLVNLLRRLGYPDAADEAARVLPDPVSVEEAANFGQKYGITRDMLISRMGGSP